MLEHMPPPALEMWTGFDELALKDGATDVVAEVVNRVSWPAVSSRLAAHGSFCADTVGFP